MLEPLQILSAPLETHHFNSHSYACPSASSSIFRHSLHFSPIAEHHSRRGGKEGGSREGRVENMKEVAKRQKRTRKNEKMTCSYIFLRRNEIFLSSKVHEYAFHAYGFLELKDIFIARRLMLCHH